MYPIHLYTTNQLSHVYKKYSYDCCNMRCHACVPYRKGDNVNVIPDDGREAQAAAAVVHGGHRVSGAKLENSAARNTTTVPGGSFELATDR